MESIKKDIEFIRNGQERIDGKLDKLIEKTTENKVVNKHQGKIIGIIFAWIFALTAKVSTVDISWLKFW